MPDRRTVIGVGLAFLVWYFVFLVDILVSFWFRVTFGVIILTVYAYSETGLPEKPSIKEIILGLVLGILLYGLFFIGFTIFKPILVGGAEGVYVFKEELPIIIPAMLLLITSFCEEYFWRKYTQRKLIEVYGSRGIIFASVLYASIHLATLNIPLIDAALIAGLFWGIIYEHTNSFWIVVFSHIAWTELIFVFLPLL